jgi:hypothetical protein
LRRIAGFLGLLGGSTEVVEFGEFWNLKFGLLEKVVRVDAARCIKREKIKV